VGLDPQQLTEIRALIRKLGGKLTVIISSHILSEISELCDHVLILSEGKLVADSSMAELMATVSPETVLRLTVKGDEAGVREVLTSIEGVSGVTALPSAETEGTVSLKVTTPADKDLRDDIFFAMAERRYAVLSMEKSEQSLEEVFLSLTARKKTNTNEEDPD
jgi:ABC-2 type transport system ATP-binding protein